MRFQLRLFCALVFVLLSSCGGYGDGGSGGSPMPGPIPAPTPPPALDYSVSATVRGLAGSGLQLKNLNETLTVVANGPATFTTSFTAGAAYSVSVVTQPIAPAQTCTVTNGSGTIANAHVTNIAVNCVSSTAARFAYSLNFDGQSISIYNVDSESGQLRSRGYAKTGKGPTMMQQNSTGQFLFVFNSGFAPSDGPAVPIPPATISVFAHDNVTGDLREVGGSPFPVSEIPLGANSMTLHASGKFIYVSNDDDISQFAVDSNGRIAELAGGPVISGPNPHPIVFHPLAQFGYSSSDRSGDIYVYELNPVTLKIEERTALRAHTGAGRVSNVTFDPTGKFAFVTNFEQGALSVFAVNDGTGALTPAPGSPYKIPGVSPSPVSFHPSGKFVYAHPSAADGTPASIAAFSINAATGALTALPNSPYAAGLAPIVLTLAPSGEYLYVTHRGSNSADGPILNGSIAAYRIDAATGIPTAIADGAVTQSAPLLSAVDPSGRYLYSVSFRTDRLFSYRIAPNGTLSPLDQGAIIRTGHRPTSIDLMVSPTVATPNVFAPRFAFSTDADGNSVAAHALNPNSGVPTLVGTAPSGGTSVRGLAVSQSGRFLYSAQLSGNATAYVVDPANGKPLAIESETIRAGISPVGIATDPSNRFVYVLNAESGTISPYRIDTATGRLTENGGAAPTIGLPLSMAIDPTGRTLYVASFSQLQTFSIDVETGTLLPLVTAGDSVIPLQVETATHIVVEPRGGYLYVVGQDAMEIFAINAFTGALIVLRVQPLAIPALTFAIDPTGRFLYTADWLDGSISFFAVNQVNGALKALGSLQIGVDPSYLAADFSGKFLHAALFDGTLATFALNPTTGALTLDARTRPSIATTPVNIVTIGEVR